MVGIDRPHHDNVASINIFEINFYSYPSEDKKPYESDLHAHMINIYQNLMGE